MQNEIPAGTKVKVAMTQKGVTTFQDAEVLAHMDGLVHVNVNGDAVSVDPSQIVDPGMPDVEGMQSAAPPVNEGAPATDNSGNEKIVADLIAQLTARVVAIEAQVADMAAWIQEEKMPAPAIQPIDPPAQENDASAGTQLPTNDEGTAVVESGDSAAGS